MVSPAGRGADPAAEMRLFCLPYAGASATVYRDWQDGLPDEVQVCPLELPGRGLRFDEEPATELEPLVAELVGTIRRHADRPFAILGYSYGAFLGFEAALRLEWRHGLSPTRLFVAAARGAVCRPSLTPAYELTDEQFLRRIELIDGTPRELLDHPEFMRMMLPVLRADFGVADAYTYRPGPLLSAPITAFGGVDDPSVTWESVRQWGRCSTAPVTARPMPGGHFFIQTARELFLRELSAELRSRVLPYC